VTKACYSEVDFYGILRFRFLKQTRDDWIVEGPRVLRAIKVIFCMNVRLALNVNVIQWRLAHWPFCLASLVQETCIKFNLHKKFDASFMYKFLARLSPALVFSLSTEL